MQRRINSLLDPEVIEGWYWGPIKQPRPPVTEAAYDLMDKCPKIIIETEPCEG